MYDSMKCPDTEISVVAVVSVVSVAGAPNENIVQIHSNIALLNVF